MQGREGKTVPYLFLWRKILHNSMYIQTQTRCVHTHAHNVYAKTHTCRNTQISFILSFNIIFFAVTNIKLVSGLCSVFPSVGLKLQAPFLFFYWLNVFLYIVVFVTYPWTYIFIIKTRVIISLCPSLDRDKKLYFSLCFLYFQCSYNAECDF